MVNQNASPVYALNPKTGFCIEPHLASQVRSCGVAGVSVKCRRSAFLASPATQIGHRGQKVSQVRRILQTCDISFCHLRRSILSPATLCAVTCDVLFCHLLRKSATGDKKCRRSGEYCRPATLCAVTCDISFCHLRCPVLPPATAPSVTWDV